MLLPKESKRRAAFRLQELIALIATVALLCLSMLTPALAGPAWDRITASGTIHVATDPAWPPYSWRDDAGDFHGFDVDVATEMARRLGLGLEFATPSWEDLVAGNWNGKWDVSVGSMTPTSGRSEILVFPAVYQFALNALAVHSENVTIQNATQARGKTIGVQTGTINEMYIRRQPLGVEGMRPPRYLIDDPEIVEFNTATALYDALALGDGIELDGVIDDLTVLMAQIREGQPFRVVGRPLQAAPAAIAIEPGDPELAQRLADVVAQMHADGFLTDLSQRWFSYDITNQPDSE